MQGPHQMAQKSRTTTLPLRSASVTGVPLTQDLATSGAASLPTSAAYSRPLAMADSREVIVPRWALSASSLFFVVSSLAASLTLAINALAAANLASASSGRL